MPSIGRLALMSFTAWIPALAAPETASRDLFEFEGHYEYRDGATLFMVADGERRSRSSARPSTRCVPRAQTRSRTPAGA